MSGVIGALKDPLFSGNLLATILPLVMQFRDQQAQRNDPNLLALLNNMVGGYNQNMGYDAESGRFGAGNPLGDPGSGYGGAFGRDSQGNPYSPVQGNVRYGLGQIAGSQGILDQMNANRAQVAQGAGIAAPANLDMGIAALGLDPSAVQGTDQGARYKPEPLRPVGPAFGGSATTGGPFVGSVAVGVNSVPQTGLAQVHQGEAIVPAGMNPMAGQAPRPLAGQSGVGSLESGGMGAPATGMMPPAPQGMASPAAMPPPAPPQAGGMPGVAPAGITAGTAMPHSLASFSW